MNWLARLAFIVISIGFMACQKNDSSTLGDYKPKFVVEGWIEEGGYPYVILTHNIPFFTTLDSAQIREIVIRWAKVTISDGKNTEVLTTFTDNSYFPPFIYRGTDLKGEAGKTYTLTIEYAGNTLKSTTTIPKAVDLDSVWFVKKEDKAQLQLRFQDPGNEKNWYKIFTKTKTDKRFIPTLLSNQDDKYFNGKSFSLQVNRGPVNNLTVKNEPYFDMGDTIEVKFSSVPKEGFDFWNSFQNEVINASNPLIGSTGKINSNIEGPAIGVWCGYGSKVYTAIVKP